MLRRHSERCVDADILASVRIRRNTACVRTVQKGAPVDGRYPFLPAAMSAMYSNLSWIKELQCERNECCYELYRLPIERLFDSKLKTENQLINVH